MKPLVFHDEATEEYEDARAFYEARRPGLGDEFRAEVVAKLRRIRAQPKAGSVHPGTVCRKVLVKRFPYKLVYLEQDAEILILAIHHNSRRPGYWLHRLPRP